LIEVLEIFMQQKNKLLINVKNLKVKAWYLLIIIFIFIGISLIFSFPDLFGLYFVPQKLFSENVYSFVKENKAICPWLEAPFPPFYYLVFGLYMKVISFFHLLPQYFFEVKICAVFEMILNPFFLFYAKLPYLLFHILSAWLFSKFVNKDRWNWFLFWLLNPILIFICFIHGQYDIIPVFFILLYQYFLEKGEEEKSALALGIGGALKHFPFLLLFPTMIYIFKTKKEKTLLYLGLVILPYVCSYLLLRGPHTSSVFLFSENYRLFDLGFSIGSQKVSIYLLFYFLISWFLFEKRNVNLFELKKTNVYIMLGFYVCVFWFGQWLSYLLPLLFLVFVSFPKLGRYLIVMNYLFFLYILVTFPGLFDSSLLKPIISGAVFHPLFIQISTSTPVKLIILPAFNSLFIWLGYLITPLKKSEGVGFTITINEIALHISPLIFYILALILFVSR